MTAEFLVLNAAYLVYTASAVFREIISLRVTLLIATFLFIAYGVVAPNWSVFGWNIPVAILHSWALWKLFSERRGVHLDDEAHGVRALFFSTLDEVKFNTLWHMGEEQEFHDETLITKGETVPALFMILDGEVEVMRPDASLRLSQYRMIGEMSSLNNATANATVQAIDKVRVRAWDKNKLAELAARQPEIEVALLKAMGQEVTRKLG